MPGKIHYRKSMRFLTDMCVFAHTYKYIMYTYIHTYIQWCIYIYFKTSANSWFRACGFSHSDFYPPQTPSAANSLLYHTRTIMSEYYRYFYFSLVFFPCFHTTNGSILINAQINAPPIHTPTHPHTPVVWSLYLCRFTVYCTSGVSYYSGVVCCGNGCYVSIKIH